jgi:uncharacterized membrane protein
MDEYLEKLFAEAYARELEHEENVVRSLSIIAAIASITLLVLREFGDGVPPFDWTILAFVGHGLIIAIGAAFLYVLVFLFVALRPRRYEHPDDADDIRRVAEEMLDFYHNEGFAGDAGEAMAVRDVRQQMIEQLARAATNNREHNLQRQRARSKAFNGLVAALALAFVLVGTIYLAETLAEASAVTVGAAVRE